MTDEPMIVPDSKPPVNERVVLLILAAVQFTSIVDFMVIMPLGPQLMRTLRHRPGAVRPDRLVVHLRARASPGWWRRR